MQFQRAPKKTPVTLLAASIGLALQLSAASALAQDAAAASSTAPTTTTAVAPAADAPPTELDAVTVTGFRGALEKALDKKRSEIGVVDAIVAEDIADFPDLNLAESLQRIRACRFRAMPAKAATSPFAAWTASSRACASTAWKR